MFRALLFAAKSKARFLRKAKKTVLILAILLPMLSNAATRTSVAAGGDWNSTTTWGGLSVPVAGDDVIIASTTGIVTLASGANGLCRKLTINSRGRLTISGGKSLTASGTLSMPRPAAGFTSALNVDNATLTIGGTATMVASSGGSRTSTLGVLNGATINLAGFRTYSVDCLINFSGTGGALNISGIVTVTGTPTINSGTGTINYSRTNGQTVFRGTYYNLKIGGSGSKTITTASTFVTNIFEIAGTATFSAVPTYSGVDYGLVYNTSNNRTVGAEWPATFAGINGVSVDASVITVNEDKTFSFDVPLTVGPSGTLTSGSNNFSFGGDFINNGTWTSSSGDITIKLGKTAQSIGKFTTSGLVSMTKTAGTVTLAGDIQGGSFALNSGGTLNLGSGQVHTFTGNWTLTLGTFNLNNSLIKVAGSISVVGAITFQPSTGTVEFNGASQTLPNTTYYNVILSGTGLKSLTGSATVNAIEIKDGPELDLGVTAVLNVTGL